MCVGFILKLALLLVLKGSNGSFLGWGVCVCPCTAEQSTKLCSGWTTPEPLLWPEDYVCCPALPWLYPSLISLEGRVE